VYWLMGEPYSSALFGWWTIVALGFSMCMGVSPSHPLTPLVAVGIALGSLFFACASPLEDSAKYARGVPRALMIMATRAANSMLVSPDLPAKFWYDAEQKMWQSKTALPDRATGVSPPWISRVAHWVGCDEPPAQTLFSPSSTYVERQKKLCESLRQGFRSGLARSSFVLIFFCLGLGLSRAVDTYLLPNDSLLKGDAYTQSGMQLLDRRLFVGMLVLIVLVSIILRMV
jgi:hypothetical protein